MSVADLPDAELLRRAAAHPLRRLRAAIAVVGCLGLIGLLATPGIRLWAFPLWVLLAAATTLPTKADKAVQRRFAPTLDDLVADAVAEDARARLLATVLFLPHGPRVTLILDLVSGALERRLSEGQGGRRERGAVDTGRLGELLPGVDPSRLRSAQVKDGVPVSWVWIDDEGLATGWHGNGTGLSGDAAGRELVGRLLELAAT